MLSATSDYHHMLMQMQSSLQGEWKPTAELAPSCPRCTSPDTKFCYYNNYSLSQPRYFCKTCKRYWTKGGSLRNVPVGGGCRKRRSRRSRAQPAKFEATVPSICNEKKNSGSSPDIDLADVFAKFLNQNSSQEPAVFSQEFSSNHEACKSDTSQSDSFGIDLVQELPGMVPGGTDQEEERLLQEFHIENELQDLLRDEEVLIPNFTWQEFGDSYAVDHEDGQLKIPADLVSGNDWCCFDL